MNRAPAWLLALVVAVFLLGAVVGLRVAEYWSTPYCPTEDSCSVDYDGTRHRWIIQER